MNDIEVTLGTQVTTYPSPTPTKNVSVIAPNTKFESSNMWCSSPNSEFVLILQTDGNLVLYRVIGAPSKLAPEAKFMGRSLWATNTMSKEDYFVIQNDGNLVIYDKRNKAIWNSGTAGVVPIGLYLQNDGNLVLYTLTPKWATNTQ